VDEQQQAISLLASLADVTTDRFRQDSGEDLRGQSVRPRDVVGADRIAKSHHRGLDRASSARDRLAVRRAILGNEDDHARIRTDDPGEEPTARGSRPRQQVIGGEVFRGARRLPKGS